MNRRGRYKLSDDYHVPTSSDISMLLTVTEISTKHSSGGSYDMVAAWSKGSRFEFGFNRLNRAASTIDKSYPDVCGVHAELDLWRKLDKLRGGTIYVAGKRSSSGTIMDNTRPCIYCSAILVEAGVRNVVFYSNSIPRKLRVSDLLNGVDNDNHID